MGTCGNRRQPNILTWRYTSTTAMHSLGMPELFVILIVVLLLFGGFSMRNIR